MDPQPAQPEPSRPDVVRPLARVAARTCARPGCPAPANSTLTFRYDAREILLDDLADERAPESYDLCVGHAERTGPPHGWSLDDRRTDPEVATGPIGGEHTVALLAEMLGRQRAGAEGAAERRSLSGDQGRLFDRQDPPRVSEPGATGEARANAW